MVNRVDSLTEKQTAAMAPFADRWIACCLDTSPINRSAIKSAIEQCYQEAGLDKPMVLIATNPVIAALAGSSRIHGAVGDAVHGAVGGTVNGAVHDAVHDAVGDAVRDAVGGAVHGAIDGAVGDAVHGAVDDAVHDAVHDAVRDAVHGAVYGVVHDAVGDAVDDAVDDAVHDAVNGTVHGAVDDAVGAAVHGAVDDAVHDAVHGAVDGVVHGAVYGVVHGAVYGVVHDAVGDAVDDAVGDAVGDAVNGTVHGAVGGAVGAAVHDAVNGAVRDAVGGTVGHAVRPVSNPVVAGRVWASWIAWRDFFFDECDLRLSADIHRKQKAYKDAATSCFWWCAWRGVAIAVEMPVVIHRQQVAARGWGSHRMHCRTGPAIAWADGTAFWFLEGVQVTRRDVEFPEAIKIGDIAKESNAEKRRLLMQQFGPSVPGVRRDGYDGTLTYLRAVGTKLVDADGGTKAIGSAPRCLVEIQDEQWPRWLVLTDGSTKRVYTIPASRDAATVAEAMRRVNCGIPCDAIYAES